MFNLRAQKRVENAILAELAESRARCMLLLHDAEAAAAQLESQVELAGTSETADAVKWYDSTKHQLKHMQDGWAHGTACFDDLEKRFDVQLSLSDAELPRHEEILKTVGMEAFASMLYNKEFSLQLLKSIGPEMAAMLDAAIERRQDGEAVQSEPSVFAEANRDLSAELAASRSNEAQLIMALSGLRAEKEAMQRQLEAKDDQLAAKDAQLTTKDDQLAVLRTTGSFLQVELNRVRKENTYTLNNVTALRKVETTLREEVAGLNADNENLAAELTASHRQNRGLQARVEVGDATINTLVRKVDEGNATIATLRREVQSKDTTLQNLREELQERDAAVDTLRVKLQSRDAAIGTLRQEAQDNEVTTKTLRQAADEAKSANLSVRSLLVDISGFPAQGKHWDTLFASMQTTRRNPCQSYSPGRQWLPAWGDGGQAQLYPSVTAALCFACVCLDNWMDDHGKARDCLQSLVNCLESAAELHVGLCHAVHFAVLEAARQRPLRFDIGLLLCQIARLIAAKCPSQYCEVAADSVCASVSGDSADKVLLDALLDGWDGELSNMVPFCLPMFNHEGRIVYVQSIGSFLLISATSLRWISVDCIDWTKSTIDIFYVEKEAVHQTIKFGKVSRELYVLLVQS